MPQQVAHLVRLEQPRQPEEVELLLAADLRLEPELAAVVEHAVEVSQRPQRLIGELVRQGVGCRFRGLRGIHRVFIERPLVVAGAVEGRDPGPDFESDYYAETYPEFSTFTRSPIEHYLRIGQRQGNVAKGPPRYQRWVDAFDTLSQHDLGRIAEDAKAIVASRITSLHRLDAEGFGHIGAIIAYAAVKRHDLVRAMVTGKKRLPANLRQPRFASPLLAAGILAVAAGAVWVLVRFA